MGSNNNKFLLISGLVMMSSFIYAQLDMGSTYFGGIGSINSSFIANQNNYGQREMDYDPRITTSFGIQVGSPLSDKWDLKSGIDYQTFGQAYEDNFAQAKFNKLIEFKYFSIPVKLKWFLKRRAATSIYGASGNGFYIGFGPQFAFQTSASYSHHINDMPVSFEEFTLAGGGNQHETLIAALDEDPAPEELFKTFDIQGYIGLGYQTFLTENVLIEIEGRTVSTILDFNKKEWQLENREGVYIGSRNVLMGLQVGVNYLF